MKYLVYKGKTITTVEIMDDLRVGPRPRLLSGELFNGSLHSPRILIRLGLLDDV